jgi:hypothetical protein
VSTATRAYACKDEERREALKDHPTLMGIDFLEVSEDQHELSVYFVGSEDEEKVVIPENLTFRNVEITGGTRITKIRVTGVEYPEDGGVIIAVTDDEDPANGVGDFSPYVLRLVGVENLDPLFSRVAFSFKVGCPAEFDCEPERECPTEILPEPELTTWRRTTLPSGGSCSTGSRSFCRAGRSATPRTSRSRSSNSSRTSATT